MLSAAINLTLTDHVAEIIIIIIIGFSRLLIGSSSSSEFTFAR
ncbi:unnamed protein product, partial [Arabidopsis halleri]